MHWEVNKAMSVRRRKQALEEAFGGLPQQAVTYGIMQSVHYALRILQISPARLADLLVDSLAISVSSSGLDGTDFLHRFAQRIAEHASKHPTRQGDLFKVCNHTKSVKHDLALSGADSSGYIERCQQCGMARVVTDDVGDWVERVTENH
jgi:hypothetical protein